MTVNGEVMVTAIVVIVLILMWLGLYWSANWSVREPSEETMADRCPVCDEPGKRTVLDPRGSKTVNVGPYETLHIVREKRPSGPTTNWTSTGPTMVSLPKKLRADTEPYQYVGYFHR